MLLTDRTGQLGRGEGRDTIFVKTYIRTCIYINDICIHVRGSGRRRKQHSETEGGRGQADCIFTEGRTKPSWGEYRWLARSPSTSRLKSRAIEDEGQRNEARLVVVPAMFPGLALWVQQCDYLTLCLTVTGAGDGTWHMIQTLDPPDNGFPNSAPRIMLYASCNPATWIRSVHAGLSNPQGLGMCKVVATRLRKDHHVSPAMPSLTKCGMTWDDSV